jgi:Protein of unknown function (DUF4038)/Putative collagen-binding domain of a collagenase
MIRLLFAAARQGIGPVRAETRTSVRSCRFGDCVCFIGLATSALFLIVACGRKESTPPGPSLTFSATPTTVEGGGKTTLAWLATNASDCVASDGWTGVKTRAGAFTLVLKNAVPTRFTISCTGNDGETLTQSVVVSQMKRSGRFPLRAIVGKRHLVDALDQPFLILGDSPWDLIVSLSDADVDVYLNDRQSRGFNSLTIELIEHSLAPNSPNDFYGNAPFAEPGDFSKPNPEYFKRAVVIVKKALDRGMLVLLAPAWMGYEGGDEGWYGEMTRSGTKVLRTYGQYLAKTFGDCPNLIWVNAGDYAPAERDLLGAVAEGIRDVNSAWLQTMESARFHTAYDFGYLRWLTLNSIYADENSVPVNADHAYRQSAMPFFLIEGRYEAVGNVNSLSVRRQMYEAILGGATGQNLGNDVVSLFRPGWQHELDSPGSRAESHLGKLFEAFPWWRLVPDGTSGQTARDMDRRFKIIYVPSGRVSADLSDLKGPRIEARWYDPTSGDYREIPGSPFLPAGTRTFSVGQNFIGDSDWVLTFRTVSD